jgi:Transposase zinc-ribbon domain
MKDSLDLFRGAFPDEATCTAHLRKQRWPEGFVCDACGGRRADRLNSRPYTYECRKCGRQTSLTARTVMHRTKLPLTLWFSAAHLIATHPESASAKRFEELLGVSYSTAWLIKEKLRHSMNGINSQRLDGIVEIGHTDFQLGENEKLSTGSRPGKIVVAAAMRFLEVRLAMIADSTAASLAAFTRDNVKPGATLRANPPLRLAAYHDDPELFEPRTPTTFCWLRKYYQGQRVAFDLCLEKFTAWHNELVRQTSFEEVLGIAVRQKPVTYWDIIGRANPRRDNATTQRQPSPGRASGIMREDG